MSFCQLAILTWAEISDISGRKLRIFHIFAREIALVNVALMHSVLASDSGQPYAGEWTKWHFPKGRGGGGKGEGAGG